MKINGIELKRPYFEGWDLLHPQFQGRRFFKWSLLDFHSIKTLKRKGI